MEKLKLCVVTASLDLDKTKEYWSSWSKNAAEYEHEFGLGMFSTVVVTPAPSQKFDFVRRLDGGFDAHVGTNGIVGTVPAFAAGVRRAAELGADIVACFHDDLRIDEKGWDRKVTHWFEVVSECGLVGFGGAQSLGAGDIYKTPFSPMQLARGGFMSNMTNAEKHGDRIYWPKRAICFDGFSQIGRAKLMVAWWNEVESWGIKHHLYDSILGALCARDSWEAWVLPVACHHAGGVTAVGNASYQEWAKMVNRKGDQGFWEEAHRIGYERLRGILPLYVS